MSRWSPDYQALDQLKLILEGSLSSDLHTRQQATHALDSAKTQVDFDNYLLHLLLKCPDAKPAVRAAAGLLLKNSLLQNFTHKTVECRSHILAEIVQGLLVDEPLVRNITGSAITSLFAITGVEGWPHLLVFLLELACHGPTLASQEGAMGALSKICEDSAIQLDQPYGNERPLDLVVPHLLELTAHASPKIRAHSLSCMNQFLLLKSQSVLPYLDAFLDRLFVLANDGDGGVRKMICTAFANVLDARPDKLFPHLNGVIAYCLQAVQEEQNEEVALEACEFLLGLASSEVPAEFFAPKVQLIIPVLLAKMVYSDVDVFVMESQDAKEEAADRDQDIKPHKVKSKSSRTTRRVEENDDEEDDSDSDLDEDGDLSEWNLRKCSAATLDVLASTLPQETLTSSLPIVQECINSEKWPIREASILALGAVAEACIDLSVSQISSIVPFLVERLSDPQPRVRQICCWTLGRYAPWVASEGSSLFAPTMMAIMRCALDHRKVVQESGCSALANFIEAGDPELISNLADALLNCFTACFHNYERRNMVILYDAVQTFVEKVGGSALQPHHLDLLLPPLIEKWGNLADDDEDLWPLLECMSSVAASLGPSFAPQAPPVFQRAIGILNRCVELDRMCVTDPNIQPLEKDFVVTSLDLIDGLVQGLGPAFFQLVKEYPSDALISDLLQCLADPVDDVRQSGYALLGDMAITLCAELVIPTLHQFMTAIGSEITSRSFNSSAVCNNATWALGEICIRVSESQLQPFLPSLVPVLVALLNSSDVESTVLENAAITLGRIGLVSPSSILPYITEILLTWSGYMMCLEENEEKETSFRGMCNILGIDPASLCNSAAGKRALKEFFTAVSHYVNPGPDLAQMFAILTDGFKGMLGAELF